MGLLEILRLRKAAALEQGGGTDSLAHVELSTPVLIEGPPVSKSTAVQIYGGSHDTSPTNKAQVPLYGVFASAKTQDSQAMFEQVARQKLCAGLPFPPKLTARIESVTGLPLSLSGLSDVYARCFPNAHIQLSEVSCKDGVFSYKVLLSDRSGQPIGRTGRQIVRHQDGSLEMHWAGFWVEPKLRGQAVAARIMQADEEFLGLMCEHPRARMTLRAGTDESAEQGAQKMGPYVWGNFGFDFAGDAASRLIEYPDRDSTGRLGPGGSLGKTDLELMQRFFPDWIDAMVAVGHLPADAPWLDELKATASHFRHPWEVATLHIDGLTVPVTIGDVRMDCDVGKAFLLWEHAPKWDGVYFVHDKDSTAHQISKAYVARSIASADAKQQQRDLQLAQILEHGDADARSAAIAEIGRSGSKDWAPALRRLAHTAPEHADACAKALLMIQGNGSSP